MAASNAGGTWQIAAASRLPLFDLPPQQQRAWLAQRLARPAPPAAVGIEKIGKRGADPYPRQEA